MALGYYVYYRVAPEAAGELERRVRRMQAALAGETGIGGRLMKKRGEPLLWMEIYEGVSAAAPFEGALERLTASHGLAEGLRAGSQRMTECFVDAGD